MMFTEEHEMLRTTVRKFVEKEINPNVEAWEEAGAFPAHELFKKLGDAGLLGLNKPEEYGGGGLDWSFPGSLDGHCKEKIENLLYKL